jgi:hypothetical protein
MLLNLSGQVLKIAGKMDRGQEVHITRTKCVERGCGRLKN